MSKKQTAVEWLEEQILLTSPTVYKLMKEANDFNQAKEMQRQQMIDFADNYVDNCVVPNENMAIPTTKDVPQYYNETYGKKD